MEDEAEVYGSHDRYCDSTIMPGRNKMDWRETANSNQHYSRMSFPEAASEEVLLKAVPTRDKFRELASGRIWTRCPGGKKNLFSSHGAKEIPWAMPYETSITNRIVF